MIRRILALALAVFAAAGLAAAEADVTTLADRLHETGENERAIDMLNGALPSARDDETRAEICWRLSRHILGMADVLMEEGADRDVLLALYEEGWNCADRAVRLDPDSHEGYYWKATNTGRRGQMKGALSALSEAKIMRDLLETAVTIYPGYADAWHTLGVLYEQVPGFPIGFGDRTLAVSFGRKAIDAGAAEYSAGITRDIKYAYYIDLARHLWARDWNEVKRSREQRKMASAYRSAAGVMEKNSCYEGIVDLDDLSDREEAKNILRWVIANIGSLTNPGMVEKRQLGEARDILDSWGG